MRVLLAEPSPQQRARLSRDLDATGTCHVIAAVEDLTATYTIAEHQVPNKAIVSASLAVQPEFEVLCALFRALSIRCSVLTTRDTPSAMETALAQRLRLPLVTPASCASGLINDRNYPAARSARRSPAGGVVSGLNFDDGIILLGASTGGVDALLRVLSSFPEDCPATLIVQHTGAQFTRGLANLMDGPIAPRVTEATIGAKPARGTVLLAPGGDRHLILKRPDDPVCGLENSPPHLGHRPSIDRLFQSAAPIARRVSAAILTGMGRDGADGLLTLKQQGAQTFGQDEKTSVVYGMPRAAHEIGAVGKQLRLDVIGPALLRTRKRGP